MHCCSQPCCALQIIGQVVAPPGRLDGARFFRQRLLLLRAIFSGRGTASHSFVRPACPRTALAHPTPLLQFTLHACISAPGLGRPYKLLQDNVLLKID